jgi:hypothetical protein
VAAGHLTNAPLFTCGRYKNVQADGSVTGDFVDLPGRMGPSDGWYPRQDSNLLPSA